MFYEGVNKCIFMGIFINKVSFDIMYNIYIIIIYIQTKDNDISYFLWHEEIGFFYVVWLRCG